MSGETQVKKKDQIHLQLLEVGEEISLDEFHQKVGGDKSNLSGYLNTLEAEGKITSRKEQLGKRGYRMIQALPLSSDNLPKVILPMVKPENTSGKSPLVKSVPITLVLEKKDNELEEIFTTGNFDKQSITNTNLPVVNDLPLYVQEAMKYWQPLDLPSFSPLQNKALDCIPFEVWISQTDLFRVIGAAISQAARLITPLITEGYVKKEYRKGKVFFQRIK